MPDKFPLVLPEDGEGVIFKPYESVVGRPGLAPPKAISPSTRGPKRWKTWV